MAYPASNFFEKTYRNSIDDVVNYFNEYHKDNYLIFNVSSRPYDYSKFDGRVVEYEWPDHQAPPITTLVDLSYRAKKYLESTVSVIKATSMELLLFIATMAKAGQELQSSVLYFIYHSTKRRPRHWPTIIAVDSAMMSMGLTNHAKQDI